MSETIDVMDRLAAWLDQTILVKGLVDDPVETVRCARIAELISVNGGYAEVNGWGAITYGGGLYGREGLDQDEAMELMQLASFLAGVAFAFPEAKAFIGGRFKAYWDERRRGLEKQDGADDGG